MWFKKKEVDKSIDWVRLANQISMGGQLQETSREQYYFPELPPTVAPEGHVLAMDSMCQAMAGYAGLEPQFYSGFLGYPLLAQLSQSSEYRSVAETTAEEMTREWGTVKGEDDEIVKKIEDELRRFGVRDLMRQQIENDHLYGGSQLFIRIKGRNEEGAKNPLLLTPAGIPKDSLEGFTVIEPIWTTPSVYNSSDPTSPDFFKPTMWYVMGKQTHADRLLTLIMRPVSDMLKPAYNFRGISMTQLIKPYVQRFQRTVDSVSSMVHTYSMTGLKTNMTNILAGGQNGMAQLTARLNMFAHYKDNRNVMAIDVDSQEEFFQLNTPLTTLDALQDQALQMLAMPAKIPLVKLLGTPPAGLSSNADGEIRTYYDHIAALQEAHIMPQMDVILKLVQLSLFGKIYEDVKFQFKPLYQLSAQEQAAANLSKAQTAQIYMQEGVIDQEEAREALSKDEDSGYNIDPDKTIEMNYEDDPLDEEKAPS